MFVSLSLLLFKFSLRWEVVCFHSKDNWQKFMFIFFSLLLWNSSYWKWRTNDWLNSSWTETKKTINKLLQLLRQKNITKHWKDRGCSPIFSWKRKGKTKNSNNEKPNIQQHSNQTEKMWKGVTSFLKILRDFCHF